MFRNCIQFSCHIVVLEQFFTHSEGIWKLKKSNIFGFSAILVISMLGICFIFFINVTFVSGVIVSFAFRGFYQNAIQLDPK